MEARAATLQHNTVTPREPWAPKLLALGRFRLQGAEIRAVKPKGLPGATAVWPLLAIAESKEASYA